MQPCPPSVPTPYGLYIRRGPRQQDHNRHHHRHHHHHHHPFEPPQAPSRLHYFGPQLKSEAVSAFPQATHPPPLLPRLPPQGTACLGGDDLSGALPLSASSSYPFVKTEAGYGSPDSAPTAAVACASRETPAKAEHNPGPGWQEGCPHHHQRHCPHLHPPPPPPPTPPPPPRPHARCLCQLHQAARQLHQAARQQRGAEQQPSTTRHGDDREAAAVQRWLADHSNGRNGRGHDAMQHQGPGLDGCEPLPQGTASTPSAVLAAAQPFHGRQNTGGLHTAAPQFAPAYAQLSAHGQPHGRPCACHGLPTQRHAASDGGPSPLAYAQHAHPMAGASTFAGAVPMDGGLFLPSDPMTMQLPVHGPTGALCADAFFAAPPTLWPATRSAATAALSPALSFSSSPLSPLSPSTTMAAAASGTGSPPSQSRQHADTHGNASAPGPAGRHAAGAARRSGESGTQAQPRAAVHATMSSLSSPLSPSPSSASSPSSPSSSSSSAASSDNSNGADNSSELRSLFAPLVIPAALLDGPSDSSNSNDNSGSGGPAQPAEAAGRLACNAKSGAHEAGQKGGQAAAAAASRGAKRPSADSGSAAGAHKRRQTDRAAKKGTAQTATATTDEGDCASEAAFDIGDYLCLSPPTGAGEANPLGLAATAPNTPSHDGTVSPGDLFVHHARADGTVSPRDLCLQGRGHSHAYDDAAAAADTVDDGGLLSFSRAGSAEADGGFLGRLAALQALKREEEGAQGRRLQQALELQQYHEQQFFEPPFGHEQPLYHHDMHAPLLGPFPPHLGAAEAYPLAPILAAAAAAATPSASPGASAFADAADEAGGALRAHAQAAQEQAEAERQRKDRLLLQLKREGYTYREIRDRGAFAEAESTLRGRFRTLTKAKQERVRKPTWTANDDRLLMDAVRCMARGRRMGQFKVGWKAVADRIVDNGGSYRFGNTTCRKRYDYLVAERGAPGPGELAGQPPDSQRW